MKSLFIYLDYQEYLSDYFTEKKSEHVYFTYRYLGDRLDLDASFLVKVLQGKMHLSLKSLHRICGYFNFDTQESEYFETLVRFGRAKTTKESKLYYEKLLQLTDIPYNQLGQDQYSYFTKWYHVTIRSLLKFYDWKKGYAELGKQLTPTISAKEAKEAIMLLKNLGLIATDQDGIYRPTDNVVTAGGLWGSAAIRSFQQETIHLAEESLDRHPKELRDISTLTVSISHKDLDEIRERAKEFRRSILQMKTENGPADIVYQVNIQVVPTTERREVS